MGRPRKEIGTDEFITCVQCNKQATQSLRVTLSIRSIEITPDFFIAYDPEIEDYDLDVCNKDCLVNYIKENINGK